MLDAFISSAQNPLALTLALILLAWLWEDASAITGALLAAEGSLSVPLAIIGIFVGITTGDLALYWFGRAGNRWRPIRARILCNKKSRYLRRRFKQRTLSNILIIRFIPGLRTLGFTLCGLWSISHRDFLFAMLSAAVIWIALIFSIVFSLGSSEFFSQGYWKWSLIGIAFLLLILNNVYAHFFIEKGIARTKGKVSQ